MLRKLLLSLCLVFAFGSAMAQEKFPPDALVQEIFTTSMVVHDGTCNERLTGKEVQCTLREGVAEEILWAIIYDDVRSKVDRIVRMTPNTSEIVFCDEKRACGMV